MNGELIYEYGKNPVNYGRLENPTFTYTEKNHTCGEYLTIDFIISDDGVIEQLGFEGDGRMVGIASMSLLSEEVEDQKFEIVEDFDKQQVLEILEVPTLTVKRMRSAMLPVLTLRNAYRSWKKMDTLEFADVLPEE